jgi:hypothetical protein
MDLGGLFIGGGGFLVFVVLMVLFVLDYRRSSYSYNLKGIPGFKPGNQLIAHDGATALAIDDASQQICVMTKRRGRPAFRVVSYKEVLSAEIIEDGNTVMRSSRSSQVGGAVVGGLLTLPLGLPIIGALVGGLTGKKVSDDIVNRLDLVLLLNDINAPRFTVNFLNQKSKKSSKIYKAAIQAARHWHSVCGAVVKRGEEAATRISQPAPAPSLPAAALSLPPRPPERFFLYLNNEVKGPYLPTEIKVLCEVGTVNGSTPLCKEGAESWSTIESTLG